MAHHYYAVRYLSAPDQVRIERADTPERAFRLAFGCSPILVRDRPCAEYKDLGTRVETLHSEKRRIALLTDPKDWRVFGATDAKDRVVLVECLANGSRSPHDGRYIVAWNPNTLWNVLDVTSTPDISKARRFSVKEAHSEWRAVSSVQCKKPNFQPNRPLLALTISINKVG